MGILIVAFFCMAGAVAADALAPDQEITMNLPDVDIRALVDFISDITKTNFIVDNRVKGKVSVISPSKITVEEAYKVFESVLEVHGFTTVQSGEFVKIVPATDARSKSIETLLKEESRAPDDKVVTQLIPLRYADPDEIKRLLTPLISKNSVLLSYQPTNVLILTDVQSNIQRLLKILMEIDVPGVGREITVIPLENGDATKMVRLLTTIFQTRAPRRKGAADSTAKFVADERINAVISLASEDETVRIKDLLAILDREVPRGKEKIRVYYLENATAEELAKTLQSLSTKQRQTATKGKKEAPVVSEKVNITADKATNSLIIMAEKDDFAVLEDIIRKLDIPRSMVYIECLIMEVNVDKGFMLGAEWIALGKGSYDGTEGAYGGGFSGGGSTGYSNIKGLMSPPIGTLPDGYSLGIFSEALELGGVSFPNLAAIVQAYQKDENVHILSTPQVLTTDNEEATIYVGRNVPYLTKSGSSTVESYNTYEYKDVGITLKITPQISKDRLIRLQISQEVTKLTGASTVEENTPTTLKRTVETTVIVDDKNTVVIGGLIDDSISLSESRVPCLGGVPVLGWLFKSMSKYQEKTNLFVFLTPYVVENPGEATELYEKKQGDIDQIKSEGVKMYKEYENMPGSKIVPKPIYTPENESE